MNLANAKSGVRYVVVKGQHPLLRGDHVWINRSGCLICKEGGGYLTKDQWAQLSRVVLKVDSLYYLRRKDD